MGFAAADPNLYRYVGNNPTNLVDPTGLWAVPEETETLRKDQGNGIDIAIKTKTFVIDESMRVNCGAVSNARPLQFDVKIIDAYKGSRKEYVGKVQGKPLYITWNGVYIKMSLGVTNIDIDQIRIVQIARFIKYENGKRTNTLADPGSRYRAEISGWKDKTAKSQGWFLDALNGERSPYMEGGGSGISGTLKQPAYMVDGPGLPLSTRNEGTEFYTCALGFKKGKNPVFLGYVYWGYY